MRLLFALLMTTATAALAQDTPPPAPAPAAAPAPATPPALKSLQQVQMHLEEWLCLY